MMVRKHGLKDGQGKTIEFLLKPDNFTIQDFEAIGFGENQHRFLRDVKGLLEKDLVAIEGEKPFCLNASRVNLRHWLFYS